MKTRVVSLLVFALILAVAPLAMADHCRICRNGHCAIAATGGYPICDDSTGTCTLTGTKCTGPHPFVEDPLAADFTVASVERLDNRQPAATTATATLVASAQTTPAATR